MDGITPVILLSICNKFKVAEDGQTEQIFEGKVLAVKNSSSIDEEDLDLLNSIKLKFLRILLVLILFSLG